MKYSAPQHKAGFIQLIITREPLEISHSNKRQNIKIFLLPINRAHLFSFIVMCTVAMQKSYTDWSKSHYVMRFLISAHHNNSAASSVPGEKCPR